MGAETSPWILYHDNAPAITSLLVCEFLTKYEMTAVTKIWPLQTSFVLEAEIHFERTQISDHRRNGKKFAMGPTATPQNAFHDAFHN
jgi:hypothetical protein